MLTGKGSGENNSVAERKKLWEVRKQAKRGFGHSGYVIKK